MLPRCAKIRSGKIRHNWNSIGAEFEDMKTIKKDFYRHIGQKRMTKEECTPSGKSRELVKKLWSLKGEVLFLPQHSVIISLLTFFKFPHLNIGL